MTKKATTKKRVTKKSTTKRGKGQHTQYGKGSQNEVKKEMHRFKRGKAVSGRGKTKVKSRKQAIAIGLSKARKKGIKVPKKAK